MNPPTSTDDAAEVARSPADPRYAEAWQRLDGRIREVAAAVCRRGGLPDDLADDVAQQVALTVFRQIGTFDRLRGAFRGWVGVIARGAVCRVYEQRGRRVRPAAGGTDAAERFDNQPDPDALGQGIATALGEVEEHARVLSVVAELAGGDPGQAERYGVFLADEGGAITPGEGQARLGLKPAAYTNARERFLVKLRERLGADAAAGAGG
ncbi:MAG: hypothetical protein K2X87_13180 [Gemmataceae bacterium]|nr:hypothetical protein [Gemmataceae bacterium]